MFFPIREKKLRYKDDEFIINGDKFFFFSLTKRAPSSEGGHSSLILFPVKLRRSRKELKISLWRNRIYSTVIIFNPHVKSTSKNFTRVRFSIVIILLVLTMNGEREIGG